MSFGLPIRWDYESRYDLVVIPLDSYISMKNVYYTKRGLIITNISSGDILEQNLLRVYDNSTNKYNAIENDISLTI